MRGKKARELRNAIKKSEMVYIGYGMLRDRIKTLEDKIGIQPKRKWWQIWG